MTSTTPDSQAGLADSDGDVLRVEHISKRYGAVTALTDVNLRLARGSGRCVRYGRGHVSSVPFPAAW